MAYQNVPVSSGYQVVEQLANFAATVGWTVHRDEARPADTSYRIVTLSAGGIYLTVIGDATTMRVNGHRGIDTGLDWDQQPDQYIFYDGDGNRENDVDERYTRPLLRFRVNPITSVHFFGAMTPEPYLYAAIELEPGFYRHFVIGHFQKFGSFNGGTFWDISGPGSDSFGSYHYYHRVPFLYNERATSDTPYGGFDCEDNAGNPSFYSFNDPSLNLYSNGGCWAAEVYAFFQANPIQFNGRSALLSPLVWANSNGYRPVGTPPEFRFVTMDYFEAGDEFTIGSETWKVFPWARRKQGAFDSVSATAPSDEATGMYGIAYRKA